MRKSHLISHSQLPAQRTIKDNHSHYKLLQCSCARRLSSTSLQQQLYNTSRVVTSYIIISIHLCVYFLTVTLSTYHTSHITHYNWNDKTYRLQTVLMTFLGLKMTVCQCVKTSRQIQDDIVKEETFTRQNDSPSNKITNAKY